MRIPYGTKHSVSIDVDLWRPIRCESCGCEFAYRQIIRVSGEATNFLWLNKQKAISSAQSQAYDAFLKRIKSVTKSPHKTFHCPNCGIYQTDMVEILKNQKRDRKVNAGILIGFVVSVLLYAIGMGSDSDFMSIAAWIIGLGIFVSFFIWSRKLYDPNAYKHTRVNQEYSSSYPVLERIALENRILKNRTKGVNNDLVLPWPPLPAKSENNFVQPISRSTAEPDVSIKDDKDVYHTKDSESTLGDDFFADYPINESK